MTRKEIIIRNLDSLTQASDIIEAYHPRQNRWVKAIFMKHNIKITNDPALANLMRLTQCNQDDELLDDIVFVFPPSIVQTILFFHILKN